MIIAKTMDSPLHQKGIPDLFYAQRIQHLAAEGKLESQGNLTTICHSEVRFAKQ